MLVVDHEKEMVLMSITNNVTEEPKLERYIVMFPEMHISHRIVLATSRKEAIQKALDGDVEDEI